VDDLYWRALNHLTQIDCSQAPGFRIYEGYCSGSASAMDVIRSIQYRPEWLSFEKRCRVVAAARTPTTLSQLLAENSPTFSPQNLPPATLSCQPSRLQLRDLLILPIQRVCRYPWVLSTLVGNTSSPSPIKETEGFELSERGPSTAGIEDALAVMRSVAEHADEANRRSLVAMRTALILSRLEDHPVSSRPEVLRAASSLVDVAIGTGCHQEARAISR
jgi:hypothetical protein